MRIINPFVYGIIDQAGMANPTIPAWINESYTQAYEDVIICSALEAYQYRNNVQLNSINLTYIEIGANHPVATNSTFLISKKFNTSGYLVEPNPDLAQSLRQHRPNDFVVEAAVTTGDEEQLEFFICNDNETSSLDKNFVNKWSGVTNNFPGLKEVITVQAVRVNDLLSLPASSRLIVLFIDVEGMDFDILQDIDYEQYRPYIIVIEPSEAYSPGNTKRMIDFMVSKRYRLINANFVNLIFEDTTKG